MEVNVAKRCLIAKSRISLRAMLPCMTRPSKRLPDHGLERGFKRLSRSRHDCLDLHGGVVSGLTDLRQIRLGEGIGLVGEHTDAARGGDDLANQLHALTGDLRASAR